jgi:RimJ/RimL family protein N-acetyltransferase
MRLQSKAMTAKKEQVKKHFDIQPILAGTYVNARPLRKDDEEELYAVAADPLIWEQHPNKNRYTRKEFSKFFSEALESGGTLLVTDAKTGAVIGSSRFYGYNEKLGEIEIGWTFLSRSHWGGKYNGELKHLMLNHALKFVKTVVFYIDHENRRSQRSLEKIGGVRDNKLDSKGRIVFRITNHQIKNES